MKDEDPGNGQVHVKNLANYTKGLTKEDIARDYRKGILRSLKRLNHEAQGVRPNLRVKEFDENLSKLQDGLKEAREYERERRKQLKF